MEAPKELKDMALAVIESLVSDDLCEDIAMTEVNNTELSKDDIKIMGKKILTIYRISHSVNPHSCYEVHDNWRKELVDLHKKLQEASK